METVLHSAMVGPPSCSRGQHQAVKAVCVWELRDEGQQPVFPEHSERPAAAPCGPDPSESV